MISTLSCKLITKKCKTPFIFQFISLDMHCSCNPLVMPSYKIPTAFQQWYKLEILSCWIKLIVYHVAETLYHSNSSKTYQIQYLLRYLIVNAEVFWKTRSKLNFWSFFHKVLFNKGMVQRNLMSHKETPQSHMRKGMF